MINNNNPPTTSTGSTQASSGHTNYEDYEYNTPPIEPEVRSSVTGSAGSHYEQTRYEYNTPTEPEDEGGGTDPIDGQGMRMDPETPSQVTDPTTLNVDIIEQDDEFVVIADLPGVNEDEINLRFTVDGLRIEATSDTDEDGDETEEEESSKIYVVQERPQSQSRVIYLPETVERNEASVESTAFENGRLTINLRKLTSEQQISI